MYEELLKKLKWRRDYFEAINFIMLASEYTESINAIESLINKIKETEKDKEE